MPDELELEMEELKKKLKADESTQEEYWDNIQQLEFQEKQRTPQGSDKSFYRAVSGACLGV